MINFPFMQRAFYPGCLGELILYFSNEVEDAHFAQRESTFKSRQNPDNLLIIPTKSRQQII